MSVDLSGIPAGVAKLGEAIGEAAKDVGRWVSNLFSGDDEPPAPPPPPAVTGPSTANNWTKTAIQAVNGTIRIPLGRSAYFTPNGARVASANVLMGVAVSVLDPVNYRVVAGAFGFDVMKAVMLPVGQDPNDYSNAVGTAVTMGVGVIAGKVAAPGAAVAAEEASRSVGAAESAFSVAANGGRNAGFLRQAEGWTPGQLQRAERSFQEMIELHEAKIANPSAHAADWATRSPQAQEGLLRHWAKEIANFSEQQSIVQEILFRRGP